MHTCPGKQTNVYLQSDAHVLFIGLRGFHTSSSFPVADITVKQSHARFPGNLTLHYGESPEVTNA